MKQFAIAVLLLGLVACAAPAESPAPDASESTPEVTAPEPEATGGSDEVDGEEAIEEPSGAKGADQAAEKPDSYYVDKVVELHTDEGVFTIRFFPDVAPKHVRNFIDLSESDFYDGTKFHRIIPGFVIQGGDPNTRGGDPSTWGTGGSGKRLEAEFNSVHHARGILSMARSTDPDSASSQFFVCVADAGSLDNQYTVFGQVASGMDVVDKIVAGEANGQIAINPVTIQDAVVREASDDEKGPTPK